MVEGGWGWGGGIAIWLVGEHSAPMYLLFGAVYWSLGCRGYFGISNVALVLFWFGLGIHKPAQILALLLSTVWLLHDKCFKLAKVTTDSQIWYNSMNYERWCCCHMTKQFCFQSPLHCAFMAGTVHRCFQCFQVIWFGTRGKSAYLVASQAVFVWFIYIKALVFGVTKEGAQVLWSYTYLNHCHAGLFWENMLAFHIIPRHWNLLCIYMYMPELGHYFLSLYIINISLTSKSLVCEYYRSIGSYWFIFQCYPKYVVVQSIILLLCFLEGTCLSNHDSDWWEMIMLIDRCFQFMLV